MFSVFSVFFILFVIGLTYIGYSSVVEYFKYQEVIIYTSSMIFLLLNGFMFSPFIYLCLYAVFFGKQADMKKQKICNTLLLSFVIFIVLCTVIFKVYYQHSLDEKEYQACNGTPLGWMVGMATQYVTDLSLCK